MNKVLTALFILFIGTHGVWAGQMPDGPSGDTAPISFCAGKCNSATDPCRKQDGGCYTVELKGFDEYVEGFVVKAYKMTKGSECVYDKESRVCKWDISEEYEHDPLACVKGYYYNGSTIPDDIEKLDGDEISMYVNSSCVQCPLADDADWGKKAMSPFAAKSQNECYAASTEVSTPPQVKP